MGIDGELSSTHGKIPYIVNSSSNIPLDLALGTSNSSFHGKDGNNGCLHGSSFIGVILYYDLMSGMTSYESNVFKVS